MNNYPSTTGNTTHFNIGIETFISRSIIDRQASTTAFCFPLFRTRINDNPAQFEIIGSCTVVKLFLLILRAYECPTFNTDGSFLTF
jgi:hypothetical protein